MAYSLAIKTDRFLKSMLMTSELSEDPKTMTLILDSFTDKKKLLANQSFTLDFY